MAELIEEVDGSSGVSRTEQVLRSVINGDIESSRQRLVHALNKLGYQVISEDPLYVRRSAQGWAAYYFSADILEFPIKLTIGLKPISSNATLATFDYAVEHPGSMSYKGDQQTLKREAEAIIALATSNATSVCTACGTKQISEARFCRICGAPNMGGSPAEIEVLRLTAGARAGHHLITTGAIWTAVSLLIALALIFLGGRTRGLAVLIPLSQVIIGLLILFWGALSLHRTLNPDLSKPSILPNNMPQGIPASEAAGIPSSPTQKFITEGTTESLAEKLKIEDKEFVYAKKRDTSPMD